MPEEPVVTITLELPEFQAEAFARLLKRLSLKDSVRRSNRVRQYPDRIPEADKMWDAVQAIERQLAEQGFALPR